MRQHYLLRSNGTGECFAGFTKVELLANLVYGRCRGEIVRIDEENRRLLIYGKPDTVSFSREFTWEEFERELAQRAIQVLTRNHSWTLYVSQTP